MNVGLNGINDSQALTDFYKNSMLNPANTGAAGADIQQRVQSNSSPFDNSDQQKTGGSGSQGQASNNPLDKFMDILKSLIQSVISMIPGLGSLVSSMGMQSGSNSSGKVSA